MRRLSALAALLVPTTALADVVTGKVHVGAVTAAAARAALSTLDARAAAATLAPTGTDHFGDGDAIVRFEQTHRGLPVVGRGASVRVDRAGDAIAAAIDLDAALPASIAPVVGAAEAAKAAAPRTVLPVAPADAHLVVFRGRLAWAVLPRTIPSLPTAPRFMIDARTGDVLEAIDLVVHANQANVYATNPVTSTLATRPLPIAPTDPNGYLTNAFVESLNCIDHKTVKSVMFGFLTLPVHVCDTEQRAKADMNGDFDYTPIDDPSNVASRSDEFSEVSMYYHATRVYEFFRSLQGDPNAQVVVDKPLRTISNLQLPPGLQKGDIQSAGDPNKPLDPFQNAFFSPAGGQLGMVFQTLYGWNAGAMWFGQGPKRDYSYDGDVVYHEFGHAVVDATLKLGGGWHVDAQGAIDAPSAANEGLADYFSSALAGDSKVGEYAAKDISSSLDGIRDIDNTDDCHGTVIGEAHFDSTFFSGGLWAVRKGLSAADQTAYDKALYKAMRMSTPKPDVGYDDLANLFLATLKTDLPGAATALEAEMKKRGVLPGCDRIYPWTGKLLYPTKIDFVRSPGYWDAPPPASVAGTPNPAPGLIQVRADFADPAAHVTVTFKNPIQNNPLNLLNMNGKPFTPKLLVKFGQPIAWTTQGAVKSDADLTIDCAGDGNKALQTFVCDFDVPDGAASAYVQVANTGDQDGLYGDFILDIQPAPPKEPPADDAGADAGTPAAPPATGCNCDAAGAPRGSLGALGAAGLAGLLAFRRRRRSATSSGA